MADYISRETALACFSDWIDRYGHEHTADEMTEYQRIEELPAADVRPVVRGRWEPSTEIMEAVDCSVCGFRKVYGAMPDGSGRDYNFCPNCGADTRELQSNG